MLRREFLQLIRRLPAELLHAGEQVPEALFGNRRGLPQIANHAGMVLYFAFQASDAIGQVGFHSADKTRPFRLVARHSAAIVTFLEEARATVRVDNRPKVTLRFQFSGSSLQYPNLVCDAERVAP